MMYPFIYIINFNLAQPSTDPNLLSSNIKTQTHGKRQWEKPFIFSDYLGKCLGLTQVFFFFFFLNTVKIKQFQIFQKGHILLLSREDGRRLSVVNFHKSNIVCMKSFTHQTFIKNKL